MSFVFTYVVSVYRLILNERASHIEKGERDDIDIYPFLPFLGLLLLLIPN